MGQGGEGGLHPLFLDLQYRREREIVLYKSIYTNEIAYEDSVGVDFLFIFFYFFYEVGLKWWN